MDDLVTLKDGKTFPKFMVNVLNLSLSGLAKNQPIALYELAMVCRDPNHKIFGNAEQLLKERSLVEPDGKIRSEIRAFVLNAVEGDGVEMKLVNPVKLEEGQAQDGPARSAIRKSADFELYKIVRYEIAEVFFQAVAELNEAIKGKGELNIGRRDDSVSFNAYYSQVNGLFMEEYYGTPSYLWTPWGKYDFRGSCSSYGVNDEDLRERLYPKLGGVIAFPERRSEMGVHGPVYALNEINGKPLPAPELLEESAFLSYKNANKEWQGFEARYREWMSKQKVRQ
ncbi:MAG: hypothetical protein FWD33_03455 [Alphaproteobacteria bacterium]|nr:hypothetical protein [Alphaproteobacteria bacterium]